MSFFNMNKIKSLFQLKKEYKKLSKQYHPDNQETGDKDKFIELKNEYDMLIENYHNVKRIYITVEQAYYGCKIDYNNVTLHIPTHYYNSKPIEVNGEKIYVAIKSTNDEQIRYERKNSIIVYKTLDIDKFDVILGYKDVKYLGLEYRIKLKSLNKFYCIEGKGYPKKDSNKREDLFIKFNYNSEPNISKDDEDIIIQMRKKYVK